MLRAGTRLHTSETATGKGQGIVVVHVQSVKMPASRRRRSRFADVPDWSRRGETLRPWSRLRDGFSVDWRRDMKINAKASLGRRADPPLVCHHV